MFQRLDDQIYDVAIVGSGIVGATIALLLAKNTPLKIVVLEEKEFSFPEDQDFYDSRVSAIALSSKHIFENVHAWGAMNAARINPYQAMEVWDAGGNGKIDF